MSKRKAVICVLVKAEKDYNVEVLMLKRPLDHDKYPGHWCLPGGKTDEGETSLQAAVRECEEETGFMPNLLQNANIYMIDEDYEVEVYVSTAFKQITDVFYPNREHIDAKWCNLRDLPKDTGNLTRKLLESLFPFNHVRI